MARFGVKEVANVTLIALSGKNKGKPELYLDTLKMSNLENGAESVYATGGQGAGRLVGWDFGRTAQFAVQDALLNPKAIAMQTGNELKKGKALIFRREVVTIDSFDMVENKAKFELSQKPAGALTVYKTTDGYDQEEVELGADLDVTPSGATDGFEVELEVDAGANVDEGDELIVYFNFEADETEEITITSNQFGGYYTVIGDTLWRNEQTGEDEAVQIVIPKAKIASAFTISMQPDGEPSVFDFTLDVFKDGKSNDMVKIIRY